jgi:hypothetical protein
MFHARGFGEGPVGVNVIIMPRSRSVGRKRVQLFGASFFGNGMNVAGVVVNKKGLKPGRAQASEGANSKRSTRGRATPTKPLSWTTTRTGSPSASTLIRRS